MRLRTLVLSIAAALAVAALIATAVMRSAPDGTAGTAKSDDGAATAARIAELEAKLAWYRWYFGEYASALRLEQYGAPTADINQLLHAHGDEFIPIEEVTASLVCPAPSNGAFSGDYIYFAARMLPLPGEDGLSVYATSYLGSGGFAHSGKAFDALLSEDSLRAAPATLDAPFGLAEDWLAENDWRDFAFEQFGDYGHSALMSYNAGDVDGDGAADFIFERWLVLSGAEYAQAAIAPRRAIFQDGAIVAVEDGALVRMVWDGSALVTTAELPLPTPPHPNVPHVVLPLPAGMIAVRTAESLDIYSAAADGFAHVSTLTGLSPGEVQTGAFGDFDGDGEDDFWLSQVATPTPYPDKQDQIVLLRLRDLQPGANRLADVAWFTVRGSARYSDYDGIGTTLSPIAGDVLGDGGPDLSFTGHRHMNESGALYILPGAAIRRGGAIDITAPEVIRVLGRPMSQMAPPFHHWDATDLTGDGHDDIVMPVDNDLCSGLNAGAIYILDGKALVERRAGDGTASD